MRILALGDSLTYGVGDPVTDGRRSPFGTPALHGWVRRLAEALDAEVEMHAVIGAGVHHVLDEQLPQVSRRPFDLVVCLIGVNDLMGRGFDAADFGRTLTAVVDRLLPLGAPVVLMRLPDLLRPFPVPPSVRRRSLARTARANAAPDLAHPRDGVLVLDPDALLAARRERVTSIDGLHPSSRGHALLADAVLQALVGAGHLPPGRTVAPSGPRHLEHARWFGSALRIVVPQLVRQRRDAR